MGKYFHNTLADVDGISGDDLNRRHREQRLGFSAPSGDWVQASKEIRCIYPGQVVRKEALDGREIAVYADRSYWMPSLDGQDMIDRPILIVG